jgi:hypothetical protein
MQTNSGKLDNKISYIPIIIVLIFILLVMLQSNKKFVLDEIDFPIVSSATSQAGVPIYYRGEGNPLRYGLYHPTLYINAQALFIKIFGFNENTVRAFGALCVLGTAFFSLLILKLFYNGNTYELSKAIFLPLYLFHPYTIANATLPDIDSTVLPFVVTLFFYIACKMAFRLDEKTERVFYQGINLREYVFLIGIFCLCLWSKLTTPIILPVFLFLVLSYINIRRRVALKVVVLITVFGTLTFLFSYWLYCYFLDLPFKYTFEFLLHSFNKGSESIFLQERIIKMYHNLLFLKQFIHWITIPFFILIFSGAFYCFHKEGFIPKKNKVLYISLVLFIFGLFLIIAYSCITPPFGGFFKYPFAGFHFLIFPFVFMFIDLVKKGNRRHLFFITMAILGFTILENYFFADKLILEKHQLDAYIIILILLLAFILGKTVFKYQQSRWISFLIVGIFTISSGFQLGLSRVQATSNYPTKYNYGQEGFNETIEFLKEKTTSKDIIWSMKDVGYYVNNKYEESYHYFQSSQLNEKLRRLMKEKKIKYYVATYGIGEDNLLAYPEILNILLSNGKVEKTFGNYVIFSSDSSENGLTFNEALQPNIELNESVKLTGFRKEKLFYDKYMIQLRFRVLKKIDKDWIIAFHAYTSENNLKYVLKDKMAHKFDNWDFNPKNQTSNWQIGDSIMISTIVSAKNIPYYLALGFYLPEIGYCGKEVDLGWVNF